MSALELKIPVPLLILLTLMAMIGIAWWGRLPLPFPLFWRLVCGSAIVIIAIATLAVCTRLFAKLKTTWLPMKPEKATALITVGIYRYTRNPMYLAWTLLLLGIAVALGDGLTLLPVPGFMLYLTRFQIIPEERALEHLFGDAYRDYTGHVRRWL